MNLFQKNISLCLQIIVVLIAGKQITENGSFIPLNETSKLLRNKGVEIFVVGVGFKENIDISELIQISGKPENVLTSEKFENLVILAEDLAKVVCGKRFYYRNWRDFVGANNCFFLSFLYLGMKVTEVSICLHILGNSYFYFIIICLL